MSADLYYTQLLSTVLNTITTPHVMVCGNLGVDTDAFETHLSVLRGYITRIRETEYVFDQTPYLDVFLPDAPKVYEKKFDIFYKGIITSGKIKALYIVPGYEQSRGVCSEIAFAEEAGIPIVYLQ